MTAIAFDTLKFTKTLTQAGASPELAEAAARAFKEASGETDPATKSDLRELRVEMRAEIRGVKAELIMWMVGLMLAQSALIIGLIQLFSK
uniref:DUF1640 domain-containing protein n=1 Tax=Candidatus Kentrum sp. FW TaxID=2126338 RepID=A0A450T9P2_9GAMM|nr:MAG: hypothetical protein BECKFW1821A_GA0114235_11481 [Candidatus Kentron sp. FW]VFJ69595.1 MAG: hypothetical protein BECKFW1821B_GA0114236_11681 [Candidatus Kentron sp. FW]